MKKLNRFILTIFLLLVLLLSSSCKRNIETLNACSLDYINIDKIEAKEFNIEDIKNKRFTYDYEYATYECVVSVTRESDHLPQKLVVGFDLPSDYHCIEIDKGYVLGFNDGEIGSGIFLYPYQKLSEYEYQLLLEDRCVALLKTDDMQHSHSLDGVCYAVTSWNKLDEELRPISLYKMYFPKNGSVIDGCQVEKICDISNENGIVATISKDDIIYIVTDNSFYSVTIQGEVNVITVPEAWQFLLKNSIVELDGYIYIGTNCGILRYSCQTSSFTWFPVEFENIIPK